MYFQKQHLLIVWAHFMVLISWVNAFDDTDEDKTLDLKIGFDLTRDLNGKPALTIRRYDDNFKSAYERDAVSKPSIRDDSFSGSEENDKARLDAKQEDKSESKQSDEEDSSNESDRKGKKSTKGINAEYEPEDYAKIHDRFSENDSNDRRQIMQ